MAAVLLAFCKDGCAVPKDLPASEDFSDLVPRVPAYHPKSSTSFPIREIFYRFMIVEREVS